ncbi:hypothetical protein EJB05_14587, partial [Eragrostis curvula]
MNSYIRAASLSLRRSTPLPSACAAAANRAPTDDRESSACTPAWQRSPSPFARSTPAVALRELHVVCRNSRAPPPADRALRDVHSGRRHPRDPCRPSPSATSTPSAAIRERFPLPAAPSARSTTTVALRKHRHQPPHSARSMPSPPFASSNDGCTLTISHTSGALPIFSNGCHQGWLPTSVIGGFGSDPVRHAREAVRALLPYPSLEFSPLQGYGSMVSCFLHSCCPFLVPESAIEYP